MSINRKTVAVIAAIGALGAGGVGIAYAVGGSDSEEQVTGPDADRAASAAVEAAGGGSVAEVEFQDSDGEGLYEVEVQRQDGSQIEVHLNGDFEPLGTEADEDAGEDEEDEGPDEE